MDNKNIEQSRVETLIPRQLVGDSLVLIDFLKEYYNFVNIEGNPSQVLNTILSNKDLDSAVDKFVLLIRKEIGEGLTKNFLTDKRTLYKHIDELYRTKGTLESISLLFRILFGVDIEIKLPKEQMLISSDGRWSQETSLFIRPTEGDPYSVVGNTIDVILPNPTSDIIKVAAVRSTELTPDIFEVKIERGYVGNITVGSTISFGGFTGEIVDTASVSEILYAGSGFKIGQFIDIEHEDSTIVNRVKVSRVDEFGGIVAIDYIKYGVEYPDGYVASISPKGYDANIDNTGGEIYDTVKPLDYGFIVLNSDTPIQFGDKVFQSHNTSIGVDVTQSTDYLTEQISNPARAFIKFNNRTVTRYKGAYPNTKGFLSSNMFIQDKYYQDYSYVIQSELELSQYESVLKKTVHPAGMAMYGEINLTSVLDLWSDTLVTLARVFQENIADVVDTNGDDAIYSFNKPLEDFPLILDDHTYILDKSSIYDVINIKNDNGNLTFNEDSFYAIGYFDIPVDANGNPLDRSATYTNLDAYRVYSF
jgi:hypothetical protein